MSDDNNQKSRGPRKGGGGKGGGFRGGDGPGRGPARGRPTSEGGRRPFRGHSGEDRPQRRSADEGQRPARRFDKASGQRDHASRAGDEKPFRGRSGDDRPRREGGERPFRTRAEGERRPQREGAPRGKSFGHRDEGGKRFDKPRFDRGERPRGGEERPRRPQRETAEAEGARAVVLPSIEPERIAKVMARAGIASRRDCEAMITEGRVSVNGKLIDSPALDVGPNDVILVDGEPLPARERTRLWLYHKPRGLVTTNHDPEGRPTVFEALPEELPRVLSIGRLDINTEGLLLLTNDGGLARVLELPATGWLRRYRVRAFGSVTQAQLDTLSDGVTIEGIHYGPVVARFEREQGSNSWLTVDLREGKNREVKTVLEHLGLAVNRLIRVSFGPFQLGDLPEGEVEEIRSRVIKDQLGEELMAKAGVDFEAPRRDELPTAPPRTPAGDDRPRRRDAGDERGGRGSARPATHDTRSDKPWKRTVWRDEEAEPHREHRAPPRRGADPKEARQAREAAGQVQRKRDKAIADPKGRRVLVERVGAVARDEAPARPQRPVRLVNPSRSARAQERDTTTAAPGRPPRKPRDEMAGGRDRSGERPWQERAPREGREHPSHDRRGEGGPRQPPRDAMGGVRPPRGEGPGRGGHRPPKGGKPFGGKGPRPGGGGRGKRG